MAVDVTITGGGSFAGSTANINNYSVSEESTPVEASDTSGGAGQITFTAVDNGALSALLINSDVSITDGDRGTITGRINNLNSTDRIISVTADSRLGRLVADKRVGPVDTTLDSVIYSYLGMCGITGDIAIDSSLASIPVVAKGWTGDMWTKIKELLVVNNAEISLVRGNVVVRPIRERRALEINNISETWTIANNDLAKAVEVYYYNSESLSDTLIYPKGGWNEDVTIYTIDAGQTTTVNIPVDVSITYVEQPEAQDYVAKEQVTSGYAVIGNDGRPITAAQWTADGGSLSVAIGEDGQSLDVTIVGATGDSIRYAPYRIAVSAGSSDYYSSLRIVGDGVHFTRESVVCPTGATNDETARDIGVTVDNIFIQTKGDAWDAASKVAGKWASPNRTISITKSYINRPGETELNYDYASFDQFDDYAVTEGLTTFNDFDTEWSGDTFSDFDAYWYAQVQDTFDFQVFGNANGARVQYRRAFYRIRSATITESSVSYVAEADTTFEEFDASADWGDPGMTFSDFDALYSGYTFNEFSLIPLPYVRAQYDD